MFAHGQEELRPVGGIRIQHPDKKKFAHGQEELRPVDGIRIHHPDKTKFTHGQEELRPVGGIRIEHPDKTKFAHGQEQTRPVGGIRIQHPDKTELIPRHPYFTPPSRPLINFAHGQEQMRPVGGIHIHHPDKTEFALGQEQMRPVGGIRILHPDKTELITRHPYFSPPTSRFSPGNRIPSATYKSEEPIRMAGTSQSNKAVPILIYDPSIAALQSNKAPSIQLKNPSISAPKAKSTEWCPLDDGIVVALPSIDEPPSSDDVNAYIFNILYGHYQKKRLPAFTDLCGG